MFVFISQNKLVFSKCFLSPEINCFFSEIDNNLMRALVMRGLNLMCALIYIKQRKKHSGLTEGATNELRVRCRPIENSPLIDLINRGQFLDTSVQRNVLLF